MKSKFIKTYSQYLNEAYLISGPHSNKLNDGINIVKKLVNSGFTPVAAAGIAGNIFKESRFNPLAGSTYFGLIQWGKDRKAKLMKLFPNSWKTTDSQLSFIYQEFKSDYSKYFEKLQTLSSPKEAAQYVGKWYEGCSDPTHPERLESANELYSEYLKQEAPSQIVPGA